MKCVMQSLITVVVCREQSGLVPFQPKQAGQQRAAPSLPAGTQQPNFWPSQPDRAQRESPEWDWSCKAQPERVPGTFMNLQFFSSTGSFLFLRPISRLWISIWQYHYPGISTIYFWYNKAH
uniref:Uncharacterized protein n=1 Tax=Setaria italica TaxID=4555 RepID=K4AGQ9_SETIT